MVRAMANDAPSAPLVLPTRAVPPRNLFAVFGGQPKLPPPVCNDIAAGELLFHVHANLDAARIGNPALVLERAPGNVVLPRANEAENLILPAVLADQGRREAQAPGSLDFRG